MQKQVEFCHSEGIVMLKFECALPNVANMCLHSSTSANLILSHKTNDDLLPKLREVMVRLPSMVFTRKVVVDQTHMRNATSVCKSIVGMYASQRYPYSMCQPMPTGLYAKYEFDAYLQKFKPRQNKSWSVEILVMSYFQRMSPYFRIDSFYTTGIQKMVTVSMQMGSVDIATQFPKQWVISIITLPVKRHDLLEVKMTFKVEQKRGKWINCRYSISRRKVTFLS